MSLSDPPPITIHLPPGGFSRSTSAQAVVDSGLPALLQTSAPSPFGLTSASITALESLADAVDLGLLAEERRRGAILADLGNAGSFALPELASPHRRLVAAFQLVVTADAFTLAARDLRVAPAVSGSLELDGLADLLEMDLPAPARATRVLRLARAYAALPRSPAGDSDPPDHALLRAVAAFLALLRGAVLDLARGSSLCAAVDALAARNVTVAGRPYRGLEVHDTPTDRTGLLPIHPENIVGNDDYLRAGLRLARDVAAYDFASRCNPKRLNPILFGLGRPGCGKTATAHAIGNRFLDECARLGVPARFLVIRRTDWASSYQNASAANLVRLFREEVYGFEGVCGAYWADIDTAFASRDSSDLRAEEKQNLAAVFAVFDGTLLPRDGKWFLICDANTLHMDEATISRIAQDPHKVDGPTTPDHFVRLLRDVLLRDVRRWLPQDDGVWRRVGEKAVALCLSGRNAESVAGNVRTHVQDFEYPEAYYQAGPDERARLLETLARPVDESRLLQFLDDWAAFRRDADARAEQERFESEVSAMVRQLNASREAAERALGPAAEVNP
ncbi:MAG: AAA family ATPase [Deltaproteobacteria bacterium]|nr:AAA family ATPase [Deltaproteobacteria bacterium]